MLRAACTITASGGGPGTYTATVLFSDAGQAPFVRVGDTFEDKDGNRYSITDWTGSPADFSSGSTLTVTFIDVDIAPATFGGFGNAGVYTPDQIDVRPGVQSAGLINSQSLNSGQNYLFDLTCSWFDSASASLAAPGAHIMDSAGKTYVITVTNAGATSVTVEEYVKEGTSPVLGAATLFNPTSNLSLFQGTPVSDPARTFARNKDDFYIDAKLTELEGLVGGGSGSGSVLKKTVTNSSGSPLAQYVAVATNVSGSIALIDLSSEASVKGFQGITSVAIADTASGEIVTYGRLENVSTGLSLGDPLYVAKDGTLTSTAPEIGVNGFVEGDFIIAIGHVTQNQDTPANKDFFLTPEIVGQL